MMTGKKCPNCGYAAHIECFGDLYPDLSLSLYLGVSVGELRTTLKADELAEWRAFDRVRSA